MPSDFPRILTLLRKEKSISQKKAATDLGISQALLSHYEKGIRECGLDFLVRVAEYYDVSCDYLLGRSPARDGSVINVEDIPEPESVGKENMLRGSMIPVLNKKLIANSLNILFDLLRRSNNKILINEVSAYLMLSVYKMFRYIHTVNEHNNPAFFQVPSPLFSLQINGAMNSCETNIAAVIKKVNIAEADAIRDRNVFAISTEMLSQSYPNFSTSLSNLIQNAENRIQKK